MANLHAALAAAVEEFHVRGREPGLTTLLEGAAGAVPVTQKTVWHALSRLLCEADPMGKDGAVHLVSAVAAFRIHCPTETAGLREAALVTGAPHWCYDTLDDPASGMALWWLRRNGWGPEIDAVLASLGDAAVSECTATSATCAGY